MIRTPDAAYFRAARDAFFRENEEFIDAADVDAAFETFVGPLAANFERMERMLEAGDFKALDDMAHQLKGAAGTISMPEIAALFRELEEAAEAADLAGCARAMLRISSAVFAKPGTSA